MSQLQLPVYSTRNILYRLYINRMMFEDTCMLIFYFIAIEIEYVREGSLTDPFFTEALLLQSPAFLQIMILSRNRVKG